MTAIFEVELPDGNILEIEAPANTPPAQIKARANAYLSQSKAPKAKAPRVGAPMGENQTNRVDKKPVNPVVSYVANQVWDRANAIRAFGHNFAKPFIGAARFAINKDAESGGEMVGDMANRFNQWADNNEAKYQAEVPDSVASYGGAMLGGAASTMLLPQARGATLLPKMGAGAVNSVGFTGLNNSAEGKPFLENAGTSGTVGALLPPAFAGSARVAKGASDKLSPVAIELYNKAKAAGIPVYAHQLLDSKFLKTLASTLNYLPFSGAGKANQSQTDAVNKALGKTIGVNTNTLDDVAMSAASTNKNRLYDEAYKGVDIVLDKQFQNDVNRIYSTYGNKLTADQKDIFASYYDDLVANENNGKMAGQVYQELRKAFKNDAFKDKSKLGEALHELRKALEGTAKRSVPAERTAMITEADRLNRNMAIIDKGLGQADGWKGQVKPGNLWNLTNSKYGATGEINDLARIGKMIQDPIPDSGTAARFLTMGGLTGGTSAVGALPFFAKAAAVGVPAARVINSPLLTKYLVGGLPKSTQKILEGLDRNSPQYAAIIAEALRKQGK